MQSSWLKLTLCALGLAVTGFVQADTHHDGYAKIFGKGDGLHHLHTTPQGHVAHAHVVNGKVNTVQVWNHSNKLHPVQVAVKKFSTTVKLHGNPTLPRASDLGLREDAEVRHIFAADGDAQPESGTRGGPVMFVGFGFFNQFTNQWIIFWFPINMVNGGDQGATPFPPGGSPVGGLPVGGGPVGGGPVGGGLPIGGTGLSPFPLLTADFSPPGGFKSYNVQLPGGFTYSAKVLPQTPGFIPVVSVFDQSGLPVNGTTAPLAGGGVLFVFTGPPGVYRIQVGSLTANGGNFSLSLQ